jgi:hypothetical protein
VISAFVGWGKDLYNRYRSDEHSLSDAERTPGGGAFASAGVVQLVERLVANEKVVGSNPIARSI